MKFKTIYDNYRLYENGDIVNKYGKKISPADNGKNYLIVNLNTEPKGNRVCKAIRDLGYSYNLVRAIKSKKNWNHISEHYNF